LNTDCRAAAARVISAVCSDGQSLGRALVRCERDVLPRDRALLRELCYGTLRQHPRLDALIQPLLQKPFKAKDDDLRQLLLVGAYQLFHSRIPDHAALAATVEATRTLGKGWAAGLVNGVLRNLQRRYPQLVEKLPPAARDAHPDWLWQQLRTAWPAQADTVIAAGNDYPPMCLRVNRRQATRDSYLDELRDAGIEASPCTLSVDGLRLAQALDVEQLPGFGAGRASVQDEAAQLAAQLLDPQPGERILDACAAPGGKTGHLLELQPQLAQLIALDSDAERLDRVADNLKRLQLDAELLLGDAATPGDWFDGQPFDRILLDAPCSGTGVIRRHPDIKVLRSEADIEALATLQGELLRALWPLLKPGGTLLYVTCSILPAENRDVVDAFLAERADAREQPIAATWGIAQRVGRQLLPAPGGCDGFYYARIVKR
jgi:16S rRNA (cytosine967-C5)-methyltransferase